ncbi:MAG TPA: ABC transporter permease subunit [Rhizomicrobium sp.]|jgi:NitT/TauT family transport system permease protein|nr:ABC transporter permease subunit [Rhizomicrobium sp.]
MKILPPVSIEARRLLPSKWDVLAAILVLGFIVLFADASRALIRPLSSLGQGYLPLDPWRLPEYAMFTALRMLIALGVSLVFTFSYATWAAKSQRAGTLLVPLLDILQSVPILGFISVTVVFFLSLAPGRIFGAELAAVFAVFTSQAWNMAFSFYQSLRTVPPEMIEAGRMFGLNGWARFWRIEVPFGMPPLIWNMMMSMSGGWFFVVQAEAVSVGHTTFILPGIGSYIASAIAQKNLAAIGWAILTMLIVILIYDQLLFRPLVAWADKFRIDNEDDGEYPESWALDVMRRSQLMDWLAKPFHAFMSWTYKLTPPARSRAGVLRDRLPSQASDALWYMLLGAIALAALRQIWLMLGGTLTWGDIGTALGLGFLTMLRVTILIALASVIWTPIGVYVGLRPKLANIVQPVAQFLAAFPANLVFPVAVFVIVHYSLNADIWLSPLMVLGTQWYILFNVIAGAIAIPRELRDAGTNFQVKGWLWWRTIALPGVFPYYVTGAITASGGSWNAAIVAEVASWGSQTARAHGLGAYIADATSAGDFHKIVLGIATMSFYVVIVNRLFWRPLYWYAERRYRMT